MRTHLLEVIFFRHSVLHPRPRLPPSLPPPLLFLILLFLWNNHGLRNDKVQRAAPVGEKGVNDHGNAVGDNGVIERAEKQVDTWRKEAPMLPSSLRSAAPPPC